MVCMIHTQAATHKHIYILIYLHRMRLIKSVLFSIMPCFSLRHIILTEHLTGLNCNKIYVAVKYFIIKFTLSDIKKKFLVL